MSPVASNTSPLIVLAKAGLLELLPGLFSEVIVPTAVSDEIMAGPVGDPMRQALPMHRWLRVVRLDPPLSPLAALQLGRGEAEAVEYARRQGNCAVLLDDRAGRRTAQAGERDYNYCGDAVDRRLRAMSVAPRYDDR